VGTAAVYAPIYAPWALTVHGQGMRISYLQAQSATTGIFDAVANYFTVSDCGLTSTAQGTTSASYGVRIGNGVGNEASFDRFERVFFFQLYDCLQSQNASNATARDCVFYTFSHDGILCQDATNPDYDGWVISGCTCYNAGLGSSANAFVEILSSGSITVTDNPSIQGPSLNYGVYMNSSASSALTIANNYFQNLGGQAISLNGAWQNITITGNQSVQASAMAGSFLFVYGSASYGFEWGCVTGNTIQGPGGSTSYYAFNFGGTMTNWTISNNSITNCYFGFALSQSGQVTIGPNTVSAVNNPIYSGSTGLANVLFLNPGFSVTYANLPACQVSSQMYCSDANSTVTAGSSTGQMAIRINGGSPVWTH
jgi:hypothetical protein